MSISTIAELIGIAIAIVLLIVLVLRRTAPQSDVNLSPVLERLQVIKSDLDRLDRIVKEDGEAARSGADERGRLLREGIEKSLSDSRAEVSQTIMNFRDEYTAASAKLRDSIQLSLTTLGDTLRTNANEAAERQKTTLEDMVKKVSVLSDTNSEAALKLRESLQQNLDTLRNENSQKLELMRQTVDEKLQGTLETRLDASFKLVSERLEQVHKGLGEMQTLATGVGDLKRVLTNVKVRGTWGETQVANLLAQVFSPEQYLSNVATRPGSNERVEFAIRLPGRGPDDQEVLLPIDAKFPREDYERLVLASEAGDPDAVEVAARALEIRIKACAKDISEKYVCVPQTTDFGILFLPTEGLYAEVLRRPGLSEFLQNEYRVSIAGPTTLHALLNSLRMGFRTLAIQQRSSEVWQVLGTVKTEFNKYGAVLEKVQKKLQEASKTVDEVAVRHRAVNRSLRSVSDASTAGAEALLQEAASELEDVASEPQA